ncbi:probable protein phosphatase 2C 30 [Triticum dicoccoides]|uniref:probable protein phosphatase 2C 30 n=1 Tax=Triticum dicoccoides TaxID=85692 RepID=UPI000E796238|nr:probable protein phosphatase 2C 30 [Triticum dicoccoides]
MSEIRRDVPEGTGAGAEGKGADSHVGSRAARRRRMEIRRHRLVAEHGAEVSRKRRKLDGESSTDEEEIEPAKYGVTSVCGRRRDMEDAVSVRPEFLPGHHFFGVFDGHGCSHVATSCGERMHEIVAEEAGGARSLGSDDADRWMGVMERSFARMDAEAVSSRSRASGAPTCRCELQLPKCDHVGSTAVVAVVGPRHLVVANCGDSRAVIGRGGAAIPLSSDHKPDRPDELERIQAAGGRVIFWDGARVFGVLAMSRAIGDSYLKPFVISDPEVRVLDRKDGEDEFLILASDGLWDVVSNEVACHVVRSCVRSKAKRRGGRSSPTSNLSPRQSSGSGSGSSSGDEAQNDGGGCADARSESDEESGEDVDEACAEAAILLTKLAIARQSSDNVSVVVVNLRRRRPRF